MRFIRQLHLYTGLTLSLALFLIAISGALLIYSYEFWQLQYEPLRTPSSPPSASEQAAARAGVPSRLRDHERRSEMNRARQSWPLAAVVHSVRLNTGRRTC